MCIGYRTATCVTFRLPLMSACGALGQLPVVTKQVGEVVVTPLRRRRGPDDLQPTGDWVASLACTKAVFPAESHFFDGRALGLRTDMAGRGRAMGFAESMAAGDKRHCLLVVHGHAGEG